MRQLKLRSTRRRRSNPVSDIRKAVIALTVVSNTLTDTLEGNPLPLSKTFLCADDGDLKKTTAAHLTAGRAQRVEVLDANDFAKLHRMLKPHQALMYGVAEQPDVKIVAKQMLRVNPDAIARDR